MSFQCCGNPRLPLDRRLRHNAQRRVYLAENGQQSAGVFDAIYGYGAPNQCGGNISYYQQTENENGDHCRLPHYADRQQQVDQYRGLNCRRLFGWDKRMQRPLASCCTSAGSGNGSLPYPYPQVQLRWCDPDFARYSNGGCGCGDSHPRYLYANNEPYRYPTPPYPQAFYMNSWPYGEHPPSAAELQTVRRENARVAEEARFENQRTSCYA